MHDVDNQEWFHRDKGGPVPNLNERSNRAPTGLWHKCNGCGETLHVPDLVANLYICVHCDFHHVMPVMDRMAMLEMDPAFAQRPVNDGFSGGEKKRNEILQMAVLKPSLAVMDETDSGLDIDALKVVSNGVNKLREENPEMSVLLITHYQRILDYIKPDVVHVMVKGKIVRSGGPEVALELEAQGYEEYKAAPVA